MTRQLRRQPGDCSCLIRPQRVRRRAFFEPARALLILLAPFAIAAGKNHPPHADHPSAPQIPASARIPVEPLGFVPPGATVATDRTSILSLDFLDQNHLLFTFRVGGLLKRLPDCPRDDEDQEIHAVVLEVPSGTVTASADWRMHDFGRYLWPLSDGRVLVRQRDQLLVAGASLDLRPYVQPESRLRDIQVSADGKLLLVEVDRERHEPEEHRKLVEDAQKIGASPPHEDVDIAILRPDTKVLVARSRVRSVVHLALIQDGFVEALPGKKDQWVLQFNPFKGDETVFGKVSSACQPEVRVLDADSISVQTCSSSGGERRAVAMDLHGQKRWEVPWDSRFIWPNYVYSSQGGRFAIGALHLSHSISALDPINNEDIQGERVQVIDTQSGKVELVLQATPAVGSGQNFALSPDGGSLAILRDGALEIYDLPPVSAPEPPKPPGK